MVEVKQMAQDGMDCATKGRNARFSGHLYIRAAYTLMENPDTLIYGAVAAVPAIYVHAVPS